MQTLQPEENAKEDPVIVLIQCEKRGKHSQDNIIIKEKKSHREKSKLQDYISQQTARNPHQIALYKPMSVKTNSYPNSSSVHNWSSSQFDTVGSTVEEDFNVKVHKDRQKNKQEILQDSKRVLERMKTFNEEMSNGNDHSWSHNKKATEKEKVSSHSKANDDRKGSKCKSRFERGDYIKNHSHSRDKENTSTKSKENSTQRTKHKHGSKGKNKDKSNKNNKSKKGDICNNRDIALKKQSEKVGGGEGCNCTCIIV